MNTSTKNTPQKGITHLLIPAILVVIAIIGFAGYRVMSNEKGTDKSVVSEEKSDTQTSNAKEENITLHNIGLSSTDDILFTQQAVREFTKFGLKGYYNFGDKLEGGRTNPNFEFSSVKEGAKVVAAIDGIVTFIKEQPEEGDYEVFIQPKDGSVWTIGYDHLTKVAVKKGDKVKAGDTLGEPSVQNNGLLRFEIQINKDVDGKTTHYCPSTLLSTDVKDSILADLKAMQEEWESVTKLDLYDTSNQDPIGCIGATTLTAEQAESR